MTDESARPVQMKHTESFKEHLRWVDAEGNPPWKKHNVQRVVSMAACIVGGHLITGNRHYCPLMIMMMEKLGIRDEDEEQGQGFVDQWGVYMTREEAWVVAEAAGQIKKHFTEGVLFSECYL